MEDFDRLEANIRNRQDNDNNGQRQGIYRWSQALYTFSYLFFEAICFISLLSISIGISALVSVSFEYFVQWEPSPFLQTYITLFMFMNFACAQARNQALYVYQIRDRFGPHVYCCFYCTYPWSLWFALLSLAYINLFYQFNQLFCSDANGDPLRGRSNHSKLPTLSGTIPEVRTTTALFLLSLSSIQYLTCRKLRWDYHMELAYMPNPPALPSCSSYFTAVVALLFVQTVVAVLYIMPFLLWLLIARLFQWSINATTFSAVVVSILVGYFGSFVERQEPFPSMNRNRMFHVVNLKLRTTVVCLINIPLVSFWFFKAEQKCLVGLSTDKHVSSGLDIFNFFLMNVCLVILNTVKFSSLSAHARRGHQMEVRMNRLRQENRVVPERPEPFLEGRDDINGNGSDRDALVPAVDATMAVTSTSQSKTQAKESFMDQDGNEVHNQTKIKVSSSGLILKREQQNNNIVKKLSNSSRPMDCNSNVVQVLQALNTNNEKILCQKDEHHFKEYDETKPFSSDHRLLSAAKMAKSDSKLVITGLNLQEKSKHLNQIDKKLQDLEEASTKTKTASHILVSNALVKLQEFDADKPCNISNLGVNATSPIPKPKGLEANTIPSTSFSSLVRSKSSNEMKLSKLLKPDKK